MELFSSHKHTLNFGKFVGHPRDGDVDWHQSSHATSFARGGIRPGQGLNGTYVRDPHSGVWFKDGSIQNPLFLPERSRSTTALCNRSELVPMNHLSLTLRRQNK
eukprot:TRINITY_DN10388_c0_g1_i1.p2 TRINITY_DN10388_c0_g1~~TRINITY_DN10388_c0_g1_i1.p2  ORF type:complete len:104 (+),score=15.06 TRINITY_DN10388_c0_g1_i1:240-551(+)